MTEEKKNTPYVTIVFVLLAVAFVFTSFDSSIVTLQPTIVSLGSRNIKMREMLTLLNQERAFLPPQLDERVLFSKVIQNELLNLEVQALKIDVSKKMARDSIQKSAQFLNTQNQFDENRLQHFLKTSRITLSQLIHYERNRLARTRLKEALLTQIHSPSVLEKLIMNGLFQERLGAYKEFFLKDHMPRLSALSHKELLKLFESSPLKSPEYRTYSFLRITPQLFLPMHKRTKNLYTKKEYDDARGRVVQMVSAIRDDLGEGKSLQDIAQKYHLSFQKVTTNARGEQPDGSKVNFHMLVNENGTKKSILNKIFSLSPDQVPEEIPFSPVDFVLVQLYSVEPEKKMSFQQAIPFLKKIWAQQQGRKNMMQKAQQFMRRPVAMTSLPPLMLSAHQAPVSPLIKETLFKMKPGELSIVEEKKRIYVVQLVSIRDGKIPSVQEKKDLIAFITKELQHVFWNTFVLSLSKKYPLTIYDQHLRDLYKK